MNLLTRKPTALNLADQPYLLAVDIGYGYTQAQDNLGGEEIQPSVYMHKPAGMQREDLEADQAAFPSLTMYNPDGTLLLGRFAERHAANPDALMSLRGRANNVGGNEFRIEMVKMAAARLLQGKVNDDAPVIHAQVVTGLPVDYLRDRDSLKSALIGTHRIITDAVDIVLNVTNAIVMPQPMGTVYAYRLTESGEVADFNYKTMVVFDFGTYTAQVVTHDLDSGGSGFIPARSFSVGAGAYIIRDKLYAWLESEYGSKDLPPSVIDEAIRTRTLKIAGEVRDVSEPIMAGCRQILDLIQTRAAATIAGALAADVVVVSGGIAPLMVKALSDVYGQGRTFLAENSQWANVRGYRAYGLFKAKLG